MTQEEIIEQREQTLQSLTDMLRHVPFSVEFNVKKKPKGAKIVIEVTREQIDKIINNTKQS